MSAIGVSDSDYKQIMARVKACGRRGVTLTGRSGPVHFHLKGKELYGDVSDLSGNKITREVVNIDKIPKTTEFKVSIKDRLREDHPDMSDEMVEANADIINEANETIKRLMTIGIEPEMAARIVITALKEENLREVLEKAKSE